MHREATQSPPLPKFDSPRPDFTDPPVIEVALSVQFEPLSALGVPQFGLLWEHYRKEFPNTEDQPALPSVTEHFEAPKPPSVKVGIISEPRPPRCWFKNAADTELIQVQQDRFVFNWRKSKAEEPYPRYPYVRAKFEAHFKTFETFLRECSIGAVLPNQCVVTYVNHLFPGRGWKRAGQFKNIFSVWSGRHSDDFLPEPEDITTQARYPMLTDGGKPFGRLHVKAEPRIKLDDASPLLRLTLVARGAPLEKNFNGVLAFLDVGREFVVRGFASVTTKKMHTIWGRTDAS